MKTTTKHPEIEKELNKRLKWMGYLLLVFAVITLVWDFFPSADNELDDLLLEIEEAPPPIHAYLISSTLALVGGACLFIYWKKKAVLGDNR